LARGLKQLMIQLTRLLAVRIRIDNIASPIDTVYGFIN